MLTSHVIDIAGTFAGAAVGSSCRFRFVAVDPRVQKLDGSEWPSVSAVQLVVGHLLRTGQLPPRASGAPSPHPIQGIGAGFIPVKWLPRASPWGPWAAEQTEGMKSPGH